MTSFFGQNKFCIEGIITIFTFTKLTLYRNKILLFQIKRYYAFKVKHHKHYEGLTPSKEQNIFNQNVLRVLPNRDQHGRRVLVLELGSK